MRDLDRNTTYTTEGVTEKRVEELYHWLLRNDTGWDNYNIKEITNVELEYDLCQRTWYIYELRGEATSIDTLFEEPSFTKTSTDLALVSNDLVGWSVEELVLEHKGLYYCDRGGVLEPFNHVMELTEEQKSYLNR